jgi:hypothetical protein
MGGRICNYLEHARTSNRKEASKGWYSMYNDVLVAVPRLIFLGEADALLTSVSRVYPKLFETVHVLSL